MTTQQLREKHAREDFNIACRAHRILKQLVGQFDTTSNHNRIALQNKLSTISTKILVAAHKATQ